MVVPSTLELIIATITVVVLAWLVLKQYYPQAILTLAGAILYLSAHWLNGVPIIEKSTGLALLDICIKIKDIFAYRAGGLGMSIMAVAGFSAYMSHIGASQALVNVSVTPVSKINNPWVVLSGAYLVSVFISLFVTSATGLGLLLMVTLYPVMRSAGISKASAVGVIVTSQAFEISHVQQNVIVAAQKISMDPVIYFTHYQLLTTAVMIVLTMFAHVWWQRRCDIKDGWDPKLHINEKEEIDHSIAMTDAPKWYALFPLLPFILLLLFSDLVLGNPQVVKSIKDIWPGYPLAPMGMNIIVSMLLPAFIGMFIHGIRIGSFREACNGYKVFVEGMGSVFASVVVLIVAAQLFADALKDMGAVNAFLNFAQYLGVAGIGMIIVVTALILFASILMGSGNASFMSFAPLVPDIASKFGLSPISVMLPMQLGSSIGRSMSPISAVVVACAGIANISTTEVVRRSIVPMAISMIVGLVVVFTLYI